MEIFIWKYHTQSTEYPEGFTAKLGNSYTFAAEPSSVDQRLFKLSFPTMFYYMEVDGVTLNLAKLPSINMGALEAFYKVHRQWKSFIYPHPIYGDVVAKFNKPLVVPQGTVAGNGSLQGFGLELLEQP